MEPTILFVKFVFSASVNWKWDLKILVCVCEEEFELGSFEEP